MIKATVSNLERVRYDCNDANTDVDIILYIYIYDNSYPLDINVMFSFLVNDSRVSFVYTRTRDYDKLMAL